MRAQTLRAYVSPIRPLRCLFGALSVALLSHVFCAASTRPPSAAPWRRARSPSTRRCVARKPRPRLSQLAQLRMP